MGNKLTDWCKERNLAFSACGETGTDLQNAPLFPLCDSAREIETVLRFMIGEPGEGSGRQLWLEREKLSADEISNRANLVRLYAQRDYFRSRNLPMLAANYRKSVFYQLNLDDAARQYATHGLPFPRNCPNRNPPLVRMHDLMFRSKAIQQEQPGQADAYERQAFGLLSETIIRTAAGRKREPRLTIHPDQIVWSRCPVRIDLAGGWTDTPPQCFSRRRPCRQHRHRTERTAADPDLYQTMQGIPHRFPLDRPRQCRTGSHLGRAATIHDGRFPRSPSRKPP